MTKLTIEVDDHIFTSISRIVASKNMAPENVDSGKLFTPEEIASYLLEKTLFGMPHRSIIPISDYQPQKTLVVLDPTKDRIKKQYRCNNCGCAVFNYYGGVSLTMNGQYNADNNMIDGDEVDWFSKLGVPDEVICPGRMVVKYDDGRVGKRRCSAIYYRIGM